VKDFSTMKILILSPHFPPTNAAGEAYSESAKVKSGKVGDPVRPEGIGDR
jgi:hypothetical protein